MESKILRWPHPALKKPCLPIDPADPGLPGLIDEMSLEMKAQRGVGLAANQIGRNVRVLILDAGAGVEVFLNPYIVTLPRERRPMREGCLSVPGWQEMVPRAETITIQRTTPHIPRYVEPWEPSQVVTETYDGLRAHILQHEIDHLEGVFFLDYRKGAADQVRTLIRKGVIK